VKTVGPFAGDSPEQLERIVALVCDLLGPDLVGLYQHGSAVLGGLHPRSDLDVLAVSARGTTRAQKQQLVNRLLATSPAGPARTGWRPVELTIVVQSEIRPWRYPPSMDFQYGEWLRSEFESGDFEPRPATTDPDLASLITMVLLANHPLLGPPPAEVLDPVPHADFITAIVSGIDGLLRDLDSDTCNVMLTLARIWSTVATGGVRPKDAAADWALARIPEDQRDVLVHARAIYLGDEVDDWEALRPQVSRRAQSIAGEIQRARSAPAAAAGA
jgi:predicted nucleotidyltransferase